MRRFIAMLFALCAVAQVHASEFPERFTATYALKKGIIEFGETRRTLKPSANGQYVFESEAIATGVFSWMLRGRIVERSTFTYQNGTIRPAEYFYERIGGKKPRTVKLSFDWATNTVTNTINNEPWEMNLEPGALDKLVYQLSLMRDMKPGRRDYKYKIADGGKLKEYHAAILGEETVETPLGKFKAVKIARVGDKRNTTLWCAPRLNYLPVKIEQTEKDDDNYTAILKSLDGITPK